MAKPTSIVKKAKRKVNHLALCLRKESFLPTTIQPQTITAGPPVVYSASGNDDMNAHSRSTHQTKMEHGCDTRDNADDRERDTKILSHSGQPKLVITSTSTLTCTKLKSRLGESQNPRVKRWVACVGDTL